MKPHYHLNTLPATSATPKWSLKSTTSKGFINILLACTLLLQTLLVIGILSIRFHLRKKLEAILSIQDILGRKTLQKLNALNTGITPTDNNEKDFIYDERLNTLEISFSKNIEKTCIFKKKKALPWQAKWGPCHD